MQIEDKLSNSLGPATFLCCRLQSCDLVQAMSFLSGGSECAANNNPLAQLSKRSELDTSLQSSIQNGSNLINSRSNQIHHDPMMNQNDKVMMNNFMNHHQNGSSQMNQPIFNHHSASSFNFRPLSTELNNINNSNNVSMIQPLQSNQNWSSEFQSSNVMSNGNHNLIQQQQQSQSQSQHLNMGQMSRAMPMNMPMMTRMPMMNQIPVQNNINALNNQQNMTSTQHQDSQVNQSNTVNWEDSFKQIEQEFQSNIPGINDPLVEIHEMNSSLDEANAYSSNIFDKYHDDYKFEEQNDFLHNPNAYEIGCKLMEGGAKLSEAALAFEAAIQEDPKHVDAWLKLGQVQIQNEKELHGIAALENCLLLDSKNLTALMSLAISYVNEGYDNAAFKTFENWIEAKYPDVVKQARNDDNNVSDDRYSLNKRITNLFLKAAQISPSGVSVDADVQTGLGVLFYSMEEYDKTLDCFQAAIRCNPNDALSWNRLGASYANSNRPEQAIEAYSKALQLNPNFVRARYNLGVSFINMGMYKDAVEHLLTGLSMHEVETPDGQVVSDTEQSSNLIETLKRAFLAMDRRDLIDKIKPGMNIQSFRSEYNV